MLVLSEAYFKGEVKSYRPQEKTNKSLAAETDGACVGALPVRSLPAPLLSQCCASVAIRMRTIHPELDEAVLGFSRTSLVGCRAGDEAQTGPLLIRVDAHLV